MEEKEKFNSNEGGTWSSSVESKQKEQSGEVEVKKKENFLKTSLRKIRTLFRGKLESEERLEEIRRKYEDEDEK